MKPIYYFCIISITKNKTFKNMTKLEVLADLYTEYTTAPENFKAVIKAQIEALEIETAGQPKFFTIYKESNGSFNSELYNKSTFTRLSDTFTKGFEELCTNLKWSKFDNEYKYKILLTKSQYKRLLNTKGGKYSLAYHAELIVIAL